MNTFRKDHLKRNNNQGTSYSPIQIIQTYFKEKLKESQKPSSRLSSLNSPKSRVKRIKTFRQVDKTFTLKQIGKDLRYFQEAKIQGKIVKGFTKPQIKNVSLENSFSNLSNLKTNESYAHSISREIKTFRREVEKSSPGQKLDAKSRIFYRKLMKVDYQSSLIPRMSRYQFKTYNLV